MATCNVANWNAILGGYAMHRYGTNALELFEQMCREGVEKDRDTGLACSSVSL
jgi:pentatricopeptide repeat protein